MIFFIHNCFHSQDIFAGAGEAAAPAITLKTAYFSWTDDARLPEEGLGKSAAAAPVTAAESAAPEIAAEEALTAAAGGSSSGSSSGSSYSKLPQDEGAVGAAVGAAAGAAAVHTSDASAAVSDGFMLRGLNFSTRALDELVAVVGAVGRLVGWWVGG